MLFRSSGMRLFNTGEIFIGDEVECSENAYISIAESLHVGDKTSIGYNCALTDSDDHFMVEVNTGEVRNNHSRIFIGKACWIGNNTNFKKGGHIPDYTTVASPNALIAKDYSSQIPPYSIIGGSPAIFLKAGYRRILNQASEQQLVEYFTNNPSLQSFYLNQQFLSDLDAYC